LVYKQKEAIENDFTTFFFLNKSNFEYIPRVFGYSYLFGLLFRRWSRLFL